MNEENPLEGLVPPEKLAELEALKQQGYLVLAMTDAKYEELVDLRRRAEASPLSLETLKAITEGGHSFDLHQEFTVMVPMGYQVVFTYEAHSAGMIRHMSVSMPDPALRHRSASQEVVGQFAAIMGFVEGSRILAQEGMREGGLKVVDIFQEDGGWSAELEGLIKECCTEEKA